MPSLLPNDVLLSILICFFHYILIIIIMMLISLYWLDRTNAIILLPKIKNVYRLSRYTIKRSSINSIIRFIVPQFQSVLRKKSG